MLFLSAARPLLPEEIPTQGFGIELRLDLFERIDMEYVAMMMKEAPLLLTLRKKSEGGQFEGSEAEREALIERLLALEPPFFDLELDMDPSFLHKTIQDHPRTKFILSYHNFEKTPDDLEAIYQKMSRYEAYTYKIAAFASSTNDALRMLLFGKHHPKVSVICMGERGEFARILGPVAGNRVDYARLDVSNGTAPGQLSLTQLVDLYCYSSLNEETAIYGLIGDPVEKSIGHRYHNQVFSDQKKNAVYVKMKVKPEELEEFIPLAKAIGMRGFSVTMPLKEAIVPFIDEIDSDAKKIGAVNTLLFKNGKIFGANTDGIGALDAIEKKIDVRGKKMVLIGAGGSARAIAFEAQKRGAELLILNRTLHRAAALALDLGCEAKGLDEVPHEYDLLINSTSDPLPINPEKIHPGALLMDLVYSPKETEFLKEGIRKGCEIVYGEEMFFNQAALQTAFWMGLC